MWGLYFKEINSFFSSLIGYITIGVFLIALGLVLWVFPDTSILNYPIATLQPLFTLAPFIFLFLLPALTMGALAEERQNGTFEFLVTKPISDFAIVLGKYLAVVSLVLLAVIPTVIYYVSVHQLGSPVGNLDVGQIIGSYIGLFLLGAVFAAIGLFGSSLSNNQIVGFIIALALSAAMYWGFSIVSRFPIFLGGIDWFIEKMGIEYHYFSISRGLIDSRDVIYFLSMIAFFILLTLISLATRNWK